MLNPPPPQFGHVDMLYELDAEQIVQRLWDETMQEFEFAKVEEVLEGMQE